MTINPAAVTIAFRLFFQQSGRGLPLIDMTHHAVAT